MKSTAKRVCVEAYELTSLRDLPPAVKIFGGLPFSTLTVTLFDHDFNVSIRVFPESQPSSTCAGVFPPEMEGKIFFV